MKGRKGHLAVDTPGLAAGPDAATGTLRTCIVWADADYAGPMLGDRVQAALLWNLEIVQPPEPGTDFQFLPRRWAVERTFAWRGRHRHLGKDYEVLLATTIAWIHAAMTDLTLRRLAQTQLSDTH